MSGARGVVLDLSRLLLRASRAAPTGIDRVELAYADYLMRHEEGRLEFAAIHPVGHLALLPRQAAQSFVQAISRRWSGTESDGKPLLMAAQRLLNGTLLRPFFDRKAVGAGSVYLNVSHHHLHRPRVIAALRRRGVRFVCLVHDLIPIELPEYVRSHAAGRHLRRIETVASLSDGIICNSATTRDGLAPYLGRAGRTPPLEVAHLGVTPQLPARPSGPDRAEPYFVCLGTIEPRKNHLLLLNIWRRLVALRGPHPVPKLVLVGRRGWENENILDVLDRSTALVGAIEERGNLSDRQTRELLLGACALVFPSFAEGYGLPIVEALALGVPVLCSDLPVLREVGGTVPDYLDPLDGTGWMEAVIAYAMPGSPRRAAQIERLAQWRPPSWDQHMQQALHLIDHRLEKTNA